MVVGKYIPIIEVAGIAKKNLVGCFSSKMVGSIALEKWMTNHWLPMLGYISKSSHIGKR
jgi:hypothetical protein